MDLRRWLVGLEQRWDQHGAHRSRNRRPGHFRIEAYLGHGSTNRVVVRGRVLDDAEPSRAASGEGVGAALTRTLRSFATHELAGVPLRVTLGDATAETSSDAEGYFRAVLTPDPQTVDGPRATGRAELADTYHGLAPPLGADVEVLLTADDARFGIVSDVDDTVLETGVQRVGRMLYRTLTGSALTRTAFPGAAELYRDLAAGRNPVFYVSSSPWNLYAFLRQFLEHHCFPPGPLLLRDLLGSAAGQEQKRERIDEVLTTNPDLPFVLIGDSGERDPEIYAEVVRAFPGRILAVYIREVRRDVRDGRVERVSRASDPLVPFVVATDSDAVGRHATRLGLLGP